MCGKTTLFTMLVVGLVAAGVWAATPIPVVNYSFELPGNGKIIGWDMADGAHYESGGGAAEVPGWESDGLAINDSGVETGWTPTNGTYTGFMKATDPNVYNLTNFLIGQGDVFQLQVDARNTWQATNFRLSLYYDNNGKRTTVATSNVAVTGTMQTFSLTFTADTVPACYGHEIGIEFDNTSTVSASWDGFDNVRLNLTSNLYRAMNPYPAHRGFYGGTSVTLTWAPGTDLPASPAPTYKVYFHQDRAKVDSDDASAYRGARDVNNCDVGSIVQGATYYWRVDTISGSTTYRGSTWTFTTIPQIAYGPDPANGAIKVPVGPVFAGQVSPVLTWQKGTGAVKGHRVYFGDSFDAVNNAPVGSSVAPFRVYLSDVNDVNWAPSESGLTPLATSKTYYWRIDAVQSTSPQVIYKGTVWSFTTVPIVGLGFITREVWAGITGSTIADLTGNANYPDNPTTTNYPTSFDAPRRWSTDYGTRIHGWLYVEDTNDYTFWLCADNVGQLWLDDVLIASNSATGYHQWDMATQSAPIHLEAGNLYYIMALQKQGADTEDYLAAAWSTSTDDNTATLIPGTSLLPFALHVQTAASGPSPGSGATDVSDTAVLRWKAGAKAIQHSVYLGTDPNAVAAATPATTQIFRGTQAATSYTPTDAPLTWGKTYYWRVDEVNIADANSPWAGGVWSFTVGRFTVVDDFEAYDSICNRIYYAWRDGGAFDANSTCGVTAYSGNATGSTVGTPDAERTITHASRQSMPVRYFSVNPPYYSEAQREWATGQDWTKNGVKSLTLWFRGVPANATVPNAPTVLYIIIQDGSAQSKTITHPDPNAALATTWQRWDIDLRDISNAGVNLASIKKMTIGMDNRANIQTAGVGTMYFDDIVLYPPRCKADAVKPVCDLNNDCIVDYRDLDLMANDWLLADQVITTAAPATTGLIGYWPLDGNANDTSGNGNNGTPGGNPVWVAAGQIGGALQVDGVDDYVNCGAATIFDLTARVTLSAWVKTADSGNGGYNPFVGKGNTSYALQHQNGNNIEFFIYDANNWYAAQYHVTSAFNNAWHHVAGTYDGSQLKVYVDGALRATTDHVGAMATSTYSVNIGSNSQETTRYYAGLIDDVRIYSRTLSAAEIAYLADTSPADGRLHVAVPSPADFYSAEPDGSQKINFRDYAVLASAWLEQKLWPQP